MAPIRIVTRSDYSFSALSQMSLRRELARLFVDTCAVAHAYRTRPRQMCGRWVLATIRCFQWSPRNNNFRKAVFLGFSIVLAALLTGNAAFGWTLNRQILLTLVLVWGVSLGVTLGLELERIDVMGATIEFETGDGSEDD